MKVIPYSPVKCFYRKFSKVVDNQFVASRRINLGFIEVVYWNGFYEIFLRFEKKRYGYFLKTFSKLNQALNFWENIEMLEIKNLLPSEITDYKPQKKRLNSLFGVNISILL